MREVGLFRPDSVTWRVVGHQSSLVGGLRSLIIQSLHPLAMAGVADFSDYRSRPLKRLQGTAAYVAATTFGTTAQAREAADRVRRIHKHVRGVDPVTGREYSADDPHTQVWVHTVEMHSFLAAYRAFAGPISDEEADAYFAENVRVAELLGTPAALVPASLAEVREYFARVRPELRMSPAARDAIHFVLRPPLGSRELLPFQLPMRTLSSGALALVPRDLRRLAGIDRSPAIDAAAIAAARPLVTALGLPLVRQVHRVVVGRDATDIGRAGVEREAAAA
ncbi:MAG TPA: oxygenase MpaB family protein [Thermoleophilaceae bacterium]